MSTISNNFADVYSSLSLSNLITSSKVTKKSIIKKIYKLFKMKYSKLPESYNNNIIDNIIYNEKSHIVATFKDRLISDDIGEFLKRFYKKKESDIRLPKFYEYYDLYSKIFPNYTAFDEGKYLYLNIQRKQRMIDLQEKMELEEKQMREKKEISCLDSESKGNIFNTDAIDSILNGTNNEGIEIIFNVNKNNIKQDEKIYNKEISNLIDEIDKYEIKKKKIEKLNNNEIKNKIIKNNNFKHNFSNVNINSNKSGKSKEKILNKNVSAPINLNYSKNKRKTNSNSSSLINISNVTYYSNIQSIISKFFKIPSYQKYNILNIYNKLNTKSKIINKSKIKNKKDNTLVEKLEKNLFKMRQKSVIFQKNLSQNISTSNQTQKDISFSKRNSSIYAKKQSTSSLSIKNSKTIQKVKNNSINKVLNNNLIHKIDIGKNSRYPLTSRNPRTGKIGVDSKKSKNSKSKKGNTYYISGVISRNRYSNNINFHNKAKSTIRGNLYSQSINKKEECQRSKSKQKKSLHKSKNKEVKTKKEEGYKKINNIKNKNSRNRIELRQRILNSGYNINSNRTNNNHSKIKNISQTKAVLNKKKINPNATSYQSGAFGIMNIKRNLVKGFDMNIFSKILNANHFNTKRFFSKTHRSYVSNKNG